MTGLSGLAGGGVYPAGTVADTAVRSYRTISPLPVSRTENFSSINSPATNNSQCETIGRVFSVALSRGSLRVAVSHHRALPCSDFPPRTCLEMPKTKSQDRCGATARPTRYLLYQRYPSDVTRKLNMLQKLLIVSLREIHPEMYPPAFSPYSCSMGHQQ